MKKLVLALLVIGSSAYAGNSDIGSSVLQGTSQKVDAYLSKMAGPSTTVSKVSKAEMHDLMRNVSDLSNYIKKQWNAEEVSEMRGFAGSASVVELDGNASEVTDSYLIRVKKDGRSFLFIDGLAYKYGIDTNKFAQANDEIRRSCDIVRFAADDARETSAIMIYCDPSTGLSNLMIRAQK